MLASPPIHSGVIPSALNSISEWLACGRYLARAADAAAGEQLGEGGVGGEAAVARGMASAAGAGAIEPARLADDREAEGPAAGLVETGDVEADQLRRLEAARPMVLAASVFVVAEAGLQRAIAALRLEREEDPVRGLGDARRRDGDGREEDREQECETAVH